MVSVPPEALLNLFAGNDFAGALEEADQHPKGLSLETDADAGFAQFPGIGVGLEETESKTSCRLFLVLRWGRHCVSSRLGDILLYRGRPMAVNVLWCSPLS